MFEGWSYSQTFRVIGQSLEERGVQDFSLTCQDEEFVVCGQRIAQLKHRWGEHREVGGNTLQLEELTLAADSR